MKYQNTDELIDKLLKNQPIKASDYFFKNLEAKLEEENSKEDIALSAFLKEQNIKASAEFTNKVMAKIAVIKAYARFKRIIPVFATAACALFAFSFFFAISQNTQSANNSYELSLYDEELASLSEYANALKSFESTKKSAIVAFLDM